MVPIRVMRDRTELSDSNPNKNTVSMILPIFTLTLEPSNPLHFSLDELRSFFHKKSAEYTHTPQGFPHRIYPPLSGRAV